jgi:hypothetical protein
MTNARPRGLRIWYIILAKNNFVIPLQEPIIYVNGIPFAPRAPDNLHANIGEHFRMVRARNEY